MPFRVIPDHTFWYQSIGSGTSVYGESLSSLRCPYPSEGQNAALCQILCRSVEPLRRYGRFSIFKMAAVRHLGFVIRLFGPTTKCILVVSVTVQNLV